MITYYITEIIRILQGCVVPMALALTFFTALSVTGEYKSNMKKFVFATCVSIGFIETMQLVESQMGNISNYILEKANNDITIILAQIIILIIYIAIYTTSTIGWIGSISSAFNLLFGGSKHDKE